MRIAIDARSIEGQYTGVGRYLLSLLKEWEKSNPKNVEFVLYFKDNIPACDFLNKEFFLKKKLASKSNFLFQNFVLPKEIKKDKADIFFSPSYMLPFAISSPAVSTLHDISFETHPEWYPTFDRFLIRTLAKNAAKKSEKILTISEFSKREILMHYGVPKERLDVIPLAAGKNFKRVEDLGKINEVKKEYGLEGPYILFVGSFFNRRHIPELIKSFAQIAKIERNLQLLLVGKNHSYPRQNIEEMIKEANLSLGRTTVVHKLFAKEEDLPVLYSGATFAVYMSDYEGFGLPALEAISCGTTLITTSSTSIPQVVGEAAIFVEDPSDVGEVTRKLWIGLQDENLREDLRALGPQQAKKFSWEQCAKDTLNAFTSI